MEVVLGVCLVNSTKTRVKTPKLLKKADCDSMLFINSSAGTKCDKLSQ